MVKLEDDWCQLAFPKFLSPQSLAFKSQFGDIKEMYTFGVNQIAPISEEPLKRNSLAFGLLQRRMLLTSSLTRVPALPLQVPNYT